MCGLTLTAWKVMKGLKILGTVDQLNDHQREVELQLKLAFLLTWGWVSMMLISLFSPLTPFPNLEKITFSSPPTELTLRVLLEA